MANYLLRDLNIILKSTSPDQATDVEMIVLFNTLNYPVTLRNENHNGSYLELKYEVVNSGFKENFLFDNYFNYNRHIDWINHPILTVTVVVEYPKDHEVSSAAKGEKDVIKPSPGDD